MVVHCDHRHSARQDSRARLSDRRADREPFVPPDDLGHVERRSSRRCTSEAVRSCAGRGRRSRSAGAVDCDRADGGHLRPLGQWSDGVGHQCARRHSRRRRATMHGAASAHRGTVDQWRRHDRCGRGRARGVRFRTRQDHSRLRTSVSSGRPARVEAVGTGSRSRGCRCLLRPICAHRTIDRRVAGAAHRQTCADEHRWRDGRRLFGARFRPAARPWTVHPVAIGRHPRPRN